MIYILETIKLFNEKISLTVSIKADFFNIEKVESLSDTNKYALFINDKLIEPKTKILFNKEYILKLIEFANDDYSNSFGVLGLNNIKDSLRFSNDSYIDLKIKYDNSNNYKYYNNNILITDKFSKKPLFYKFYFNIGSYDELKLIDLEGNEIDFLFKEFKDDKIFYFNKELFNEYYLVVDGNKFNIDIFENNKFKIFSTPFKDNEISFSKPKYIQFFNIKTLIEGEKFKVTYTNDKNTETIIEINSLSVVPENPTDNFIYIDDYITNLKIESLDNNYVNDLKNNKSAIYFQDVNIQSGNDVYYYRKENQSLPIFIAKKIEEEYSFENEYNYSFDEILPEKKYYIENNEIIESETGNISFNDFSFLDTFLIPNDFKTSNSFTLTEQIFKIKEYTEESIIFWKENFKSINTNIKAGD